MSLQIYDDPDFPQLPPTGIFIAKPIGSDPSYKLTVPSHTEPTTQTASSSQPLIFFIPGNPGLPDYYISYLTNLSKHLPHYEIVCASHLGQDPLISQAESKPYLAPVEDYFTLDQQVAHKVNLIRSLCKNSKNRAVYVFGHSVGAWVAQRVAVRLSSQESKESNIDLKFVGLITPTIIDIAKSEKGEMLVWWSSKVEKLVPMLSLANIGFALSKFVSTCIPLAWQRPIITRVMGHDIENHVVQATIKLINRPDIVHQCLKLSGEEMIRIGSELEPRDIQRFWRSKLDNGSGTETDSSFDSNKWKLLNNVKVWVWFASNDHWVAPSSRAKLMEQYAFADNVLMEVGKGAMNMESLADVEHSFCVRKSEEFADITSKRILFFDQI